MIVPLPEIMKVFVAAEAVTAFCPVVVRADPVRETASPFVTGVYAVVPSCTSWNCVASKTMVVSMRFTYRASVGAILSATGIASPTRIGEGSVGTIVRLTVVVVTVTCDEGTVAVTSS